MRIALIVPFAFFATPVLAHGHAPPPDRSLDGAAAALSNPAVQDGVALLVTQLAGAMLDTHVGPLARYADPRDGIRPDTTLRDLAARNDPAFEHHLHDSARGAVAATGQAARDAVAMRNELAATADRLRRVLNQASDGY